MLFSLLVITYLTCDVQGLRLQRKNKQAVGLFRQGRYQRTNNENIQKRQSFEMGQTVNEEKELQNGNNDDILKTPQPTKDTPPQCYKSQCTRKKIKVKVYIKDDLWDISTEAKPAAYFTQKVKTFFSGINKHLARLDNGGFEVVFNNTVTKLSKSDITFGPTYKAIGHPVVGGV